MPDAGPATVLMARGKQLRLSAQRILRRASCSPSICTGHMPGERKTEFISSGPEEIRVPFAGYSRISSLVFSFALRMAWRIRSGRYVVRFAGRIRKRVANP